MTGSTLTFLAANPAPNPETGLISIRPLDAGYHVTSREASNHAFCQAYEVCPFGVCHRANMQASAL
ncbi:hypothetical protein ACFLV7_12995 [Chloroflexota bacterium]